MKTIMSSTTRAIAPAGLSDGTVEEEIIRWVNERIGKILLIGIGNLGLKETVEEIRLRINQPVMIRTDRREYFLNSGGQVGARKNVTLVTKEDLHDILEKMTYSSLYAAEEELRNGFLTLPGGHRVGISGEAVVENGRIRTIRNISALNIRLARQPETKALDLLKLIIQPDKSLCHTLIISPPRAGKTTVLRMLIRLLSNGVPEIGLAGQQVGVVDERSEIAGAWQGIPSFDLGCRTDILDRCPKVQGLNMLIRSMAPGVVAVDELGGPEDAAALNDAVRCGVKVLATAHAATLEEIRRRAFLQDLFQPPIFERVVILSRDRGPGTLAGVYESSGRELFKCLKDTEHAGKISPRDGGS